MKSFKSLVSEVAQPKSEEEKRFKDQHTVDIAPHPTATEFQHKGTVKPKAKRIADQEGDANYDKAYTVKEETEELDELSKNTVRSYYNKAGEQGKKIMGNMMVGGGDWSKDGKDTATLKKRAAGRAMALKRRSGEVKMSEETEELDEISRDLARRYIRKVADKTNTGELSTKEVMKRRPGVNLAGKKAYPDIAGEPKVRATESVEQLDELSPNTLKSYTKKAKSNLQKHQRKTNDWDSRTDSRTGKIMNYPWKGGEAPSKDTEDKTRKAVSKRSTGIFTARGKLGMKKNSFSTKVKAKESFDLSDYTVEELEDFMMSEEFEQLDELNKKTLGSYIKKANLSAMDHARKSGEYNNPDQPKNFSKAMDRMRGIKKATDKLVAKEEVELDEAKLSTSQRDRLDDLILNVYTTTSPEYDGGELPQKYLKAIEKEFGATIAKQVDDGSYQMHFGRDNQAHGYDKLASRQWSSKFKGGPRVTAAGKMNKQDVGALKTRIKNDKKFGGLLKSVKLPEEVEQLDELSPNTLHSYIKKAAGNLAGNAAVAAAQASSSMKKSSPDVKRKIKNRMTGITGASGRLADKANADQYEEVQQMDENWQEEIPMMMRQLEFIAYAAEEIMDYVDMAGDPEEWFQNKISGIHDSMLSMYAYAQGGRRAGYGFDESVDEALKGGQKKLDHNKNGKLDAQDFHMMRKKKKVSEESEQIDEISQDKLRDYHAKAGSDRQKAKAEVEKGMKNTRPSASSAQDTANSYKRFTKRGKGMTAAANKMSEEVEILDEAFKQGIVKLKDGSSVALKKEDADLLNQLFKDLSAANRSKMQEVAMKDKTGFEEILGFAREAL